MPDRLIWRWGLIAALAVTLWRVVFLAFSQVELFVDESQYWAWGQAMEWGYYSKPPLIGWVIRAFTDLGGDTAFWVRLPGPLFHLGTALILMVATARWAPVAAAVAAGLAYLTMPGIVLGSLLISTDTILLPFFALAVALYLSLIARPSAGLAAVLGAVIGLGFLAKYAAVYLWLGVAVAALWPGARLAWRDLGLALGVFLLTIAPNLWWNLQNDLQTLSHTVDNADWIRDPGGRRGLNWASLAEFWGGQFAFAGPLLFAVILWAWARAGWGSRTQKVLLALSLPILVLVSGQAILSRAYANWAAMAYVAGLMLAVPMMWQRARGLVIAAVGVNTILALTLPALTPWADILRAGDRLLFDRYVGRAALSQAALNAAEREGVSAIVAENRDVLADLFFRAASHDLPIYAAPFTGPTPHYFAQRHLVPPDLVGQVLYLGETLPEGCGGKTIFDWQTEEGAYARWTYVATRVPAGCLTSQ